MKNIEVIEYKEGIDSYIRYLSDKDVNTVKSNINDILYILNINEYNLEKLENQGALKRVWNNITGKNKNLKEINANNLLKVQKLSLRIISELEKQNMLTREIQVMMYTKLNEISESNLQLKNFIAEVLNKIADRFENIESQTSFNMLIHEIKEGIYHTNSKLLSLLKVIANINAKDIKDDRNLLLLMKVLENNNIIDDKEQPLRMYLENISTFSTEDSKKILETIKYYEDDSIVSSIIESLKYASNDEKKKKFMKFNKTLSTIEENIEIDAELSSIELVDFFIDEIKEKSNNIEIKNEQYSISNTNDIEYIALTEDIYEYDCNGQENSNYLDDFNIIEDELFIENLDTKEFCNENIKVNSQIKVDGKLIFKNCNIELNEKIRILSKNYKVLTDSHSKNLDTATNLLVKPTVKFVKCNIKIEGLLNNYIEVGEISEYEDNIPQLVFEDCILELDENIDINNIVDKSIISLTGKTEINFENTSINKLYNLIIINKNLMSIHYSFLSARNNDINISFNNCKFNDSKGYIIHRGRDLNILINNCNINNHIPIIKLDKEIDIDVDNRYRRIDETKGKYIINCEYNKKLIISNCNFENIKLPILSTDCKDLRIENSKFTNCISEYETININKGIPFGVIKMSIYNSNFNNCNTLLINRGSINNCNFENMKSIEETVDGRYIINNRGGAIYSSSIGVQKISDCKFINCNSRVGGAIYKHGSRWDSSIENCQFYNCTATKFGGAIRIFSNDLSDSCGVKIEQCKFVNCSSDGGTDEDDIVNFGCYYKTGFFKDKWEEFDSATLENCDFIEQR